MVIVYDAVVPSEINPPLRPLAPAAILRASNTLTFIPARASQSATAVPVMPAPITATSVWSEPCNRLLENTLSVSFSSSCHRDVLPNRVSPISFKLNERGRPQGQRPYYTRSCLLSHWRV